MPILVLISCNQQKNTQINELINSWISFESQNEGVDSFSDSNSSFSNFLLEFNEFKSSYLYENIKSSEDFQQIFTKLETGINEKNFEVIRANLFQLELFDNAITLKSNQLYLYLTIFFISICIVISIILYILLQKYEKKKAEAKEQGIYSNFIVEGIEAERSRISKEIHDTILQDLKVLSLKCEQLDSDNNSSEKTIKAELINSTNLCIKQLRNICNNLTPSELKFKTKDKNGFILALKNLTTQFMEQTKIECTVRIQEDLDFSSLGMNQITNIFRIIQEALSNIGIHSGATRSSIVITNNNTDDSKKAIKFFITDNGKGFNADKILKDNFSQSSHFGISNMKERAKILGANFQIISAAGEETEITLEVPLK